MNIRRATNQDIIKVMDLLSQVLEIHADIRPDIFIPNTTKYSSSELKEMFKDDTKPVYVAVIEDEVVGYAFCVIEEPISSINMVPFKTLFIDDFCIDNKARGHGVGHKLLEFLKEEAERLGCYEVTLNVWQGNESAKHFYEKMGFKTKKTVMELILD